VQALLFNETQNLLPVSFHSSYIYGCPVFTAQNRFFSKSRVAFIKCSVIPKLASHNAASASYTFRDINQNTLAHETIPLKLNNLRIIIY
jgi:hypothetical protein